MATALCETTNGPVERVQITRFVRKEAGAEVHRYKPKKRAVIYPWAGAFEGYARNWVRKNFWRVREVCITEEDALQDCAMVFARVSNKYAALVNDPSWMMALYKQALANHFHNLSTAATSRRGREVLPDPEHEVVSIDYSYGPLAAAVAGASDAAKAVLASVASAPAEFLTLLLGRDDQTLTDAQLDNRWRRLLRISGGSGSIVAELRALLS